MVSDVGLKVVILSYLGYLKVVLDIVMFLPSCFDIVMFLPSAGDTIAADQAKLQLRDRCKQRAFEKAWDTYSAAFKSYYEQLDRAGKTAVVNDGMVKVSARKFDNKCEQLFHWQESCKRQRTSEAEVGSEACIQEIAETRMGGPERLQQAISRGLSHAI